MDRDKLSKNVNLSKLNDAFCIIIELNYEKTGTILIQEHSQKNQKWTKYLWS